MASGPLQPQTLSIVIPAFDEERRLPALLPALGEQADAVAVASGLELAEVIVVDDGSTDRTAELLHEYAGFPGRFRALRFERNLGKGAAVKAGLLAARGDVALVTDVDLSTPLADLELLAAALRDGADLVLGSRALPDSRILIRQRASRERLGKVFNTVLRGLTGLPFRDTQCGFKLVHLPTVRPVVQRLRISGFAFDAELCVRARQEGLDIVDVPVTWSNHPESHVGLRSAMRMGLDLLRIARWSRSGRQARVASR